MSILADTIGGSWTPLLLVFGAVAIMMMILRRNYRPTGTVREVARDNMTRLKEQREVRDTMDTLLIELEEVSRQVAAQIETRFAKLEVAIRDADARVAELRALAEAEGARDDLRPLEAPQLPSTGDDRPQQPGNALDLLVGDDEHEPSASDPGPAEEPAEPLMVDNKRLEMAAALKRRVYELQDAGRRPLEIAESMGVTLGEVELLLQLRGFRRP